MNIDKIRTVSSIDHINNVETAWKKFILSSSIDKFSLRDDIANSWSRCLERNISPYNSKNLGVDSNYDQYRSENLHLISVSEQYMKKLYGMLKGNGFIIILTDSNGVILHVIGDRKMYSAAESLSVVAGGNCSENVLGTTSPGICIEQKVAIQVLMFEHYCQLYHSWCCSAAPIFDKSHNLIGSIDVTNADHSVHHPHLLDLVQMTAQSIGLELSYRMLQGDFKKTYHYVESILNDSPDPLIVLDENDKLSHLNRKASAMLGISSSNLLGKDMRSFVKNYPSFKSDLQCGRKFSKLEVSAPSGCLLFDTKITKIEDINSNSQGVICSFAVPSRHPVYNNVSKYCFDDFIHQSDVVAKLISEAKKISMTGINVLIEGESGTGKEILAQAIHHYSPRRDKPFVAVNCASMPKDLIQSELFGYEDGAFTGANRKGKIGKFELANGGTIFLDEIGDMPLEAQANLLRVLQEKYIVRLGGLQPVPIDVRVISATNKNLFQEIEAGCFRQDLYYRLAIMSLSVPPLRDRQDDLWLLLEFFFQKHNMHMASENDLTFSEDVRDRLTNYTWPGNVRELENAAVYILNKSEHGFVTSKSIPPQIARADIEQRCTHTIKNLEEDAIVTAMRKCNNNISKASRSLGVSRATIYRKLKKMESLHSIHF
jgi:transcriptional regulator of acetoin/glycerol metabolism